MAEISDVESGKKGLCMKNSPCALNALVLFLIKKETKKTRRDVHGSQLPMRSVRHSMTPSLSH